MQFLLMTVNLRLAVCNIPNTGRKSGEETELEEEDGGKKEMSLLLQIIKSSSPAGGSRYKVNIHP